MGEKVKVVYVAGPFRAENSWLIERNIREAEALALEVWRSGAACICPHANTRHYQGAAPDSLWLDGDIEIMKRCDAVLTTWRWRSSHGARGEVESAKIMGIPVFHEIKALRRWLEEQENV